MKAYVGMEVQLHAFLTLALDWSLWSEKRCNIIIGDPE
jgi:hypothetical protein